MMRLGVFWVAVFLLPCAQVSPPVRPVGEFNVPYVPNGHPLQKLDIYYPPDTTPGPWPVMMYVHGGAWVTGDKSQVHYKDEFFTQRGYIFVSLNYRLAPKATWRDMAKDVATAIAWVYRNIAPRGGDSTRLFLMGHSAGAHLSALVATDESYLQASGLDLFVLKGVVLLDTRAYDIPALADSTGQLPPLYAPIFGDDPREWREASPIYHIAPNKGIPPMVIVWSRGTRWGNPAPREAAARRFAQALESAEVPTLLVDGSDYTHRELNVMFGAPGDSIAPTVMEWLEEHAVLPLDHP